MRRAGLLAGAALALGPGLAQAQSAFDGVWCDAAAGEAMYLRDGTLGFNEHTVCETDPALNIGQATPWRGIVDCRNVYVIEFRDDGTFDTVEMPTPSVSLRIAARGIDRLAVSVDEGPPNLFVRCDE
ncbi:hypothetical protein [Jannaschia pohangensis]|uniref:Secreted protein n=1 Tax=Jannaschia pohangensis TaxID=390807 RepID=A0A1I3JB17_9RHOB|nr:hypothetical protein [Jannaschia pohangensis]SFI57422.1 hypothetical protein SAMN04488095_1269 [Jannaschia pohangensis]